MIVILSNAWCNIHNCCYNFKLVLQLSRHFTTRVSMHMSGEQFDWKLTETKSILMTVTVKAGTSKVENATLLCRIKSWIVWNSSLVSWRATEITSHTICQTQTDLILSDVRMMLSDLLIVFLNFRTDWQDFKYLHCLQPLPWVDSSINCLDCSSTSNANFKISWIKRNSPPSLQSPIQM